MDYTWMALGKEELEARLGGVEIGMSGIDKNIALMRIRTIPSLEMILVPEHTGETFNLLRMISS